MNSYLKYIMSGLCFTYVATSSFAQTALHKSFVDSCVLMRVTDDAEHCESEHEMAYELKVTGALITGTIYEENKKPSVDVTKDLVNGWSHWNGDNQFKPAYVKQRNGGEVRRIEIPNLKRRKFRSESEVNVDLPTTKAKLDMNMIICPSILDLIPQNVTVDIKGSGHGYSYSYNGDVKYISNDITIAPNYGSILFHSTSSNTTKRASMNPLRNYISSVQIDGEIPLPELSNDDLMTLVKLNWIRVDLEFYDLNFVYLDPSYSTNAKKISATIMVPLVDGISVPAGEIK